MNTIEAFSALHSPAAERNKEPIRRILVPLLPTKGSLLEVASGALQHALHLAPHMPGLRWQASEIDERVLALASDYQTALGARWPTNLLPPLRLDVTAGPWDQPDFDVIYTANLLHIAPPAATQGLFALAAAHLAPDGQVVIYGPFRRGGAFTSDGDARFHESLQASNPDWGIRALEDVEHAAQQAGLHLRQALAMPANNWLLQFTRSID